MKTGRLLFCIFLLVISSSAIAQQNHFIYIQSEDRQPFYILLNGKNYSSSPNGYLTLSGLSETGYVFTVGFVKNKYPEQKFAINVQDDEGFSLKQAEDKGWSLFDLQSQTSITANQPVTVFNTKAPNTSNIFGTPNISKDTALAVDTTVMVQVKLASTVLKMLDKEGKEGIDQVYIDQFNGKADTIAIFIPTVFMENKATPADSVALHCTLATEEDFRKLRAQMAAATDETGMIEAATSTFKEKCFSAEQIKNLSVLFLEEQHRYNFFVASKPFVYDAKNFASLQSQLSSPALIQQFKNLAE